MKILDAFDADFVDIQGDGGFGLFWGDRRYERALCAGISIRTFSADFTQRLEKKWPEAPSTGFKVGIASGSILVKKVGLPRHLDLQEPVWAGKPVNYAAKASQQTDPDHILVTGSIWDEVENNDFLAFSCGCSDGQPDAVSPSLLWEDRTLENIPDDERFGQALKSGWCAIHGEEFCNAILVGETKRAGVTEKALHSRNLLASGSVERNEATKRRRRARNNSAPNSCSNAPTNFAQCSRNWHRKRPSSPHQVILCQRQRIKKLAVQEKFTSGAVRVPFMDP